MLVVIELRRTRANADQAKVDGQESFVMCLVVLTVPHALAKKLRELSWNNRMHPSYSLDLGSSSSLWRKFCW